MGDGQGAANASVAVTTAGVEGTWQSTSQGRTRTLRLNQGACFPTFCGTLVGGSYDDSVTYNAVVEGRVGPDRTIGFSAKKLDVPPAFSFYGTLNSTVTAFTGRDSVSGETLTFIKQ